jgi:hypothetical protein
VGGDDDVLLLPLTALLALLLLLQTHLWQLGRLIPPRLNAHLESHGVLPLLYGASWLMTCFSADFPASFSAR